MKVIKQSLSNHQVCWESFVCLSQMAAEFARENGNVAAEMCFSEALILWEEHRDVWEDAKLVLFGELYARLMRRYPAFIGMVKRHESDLRLPKMYKDLVSLGIEMTGTTAKN